MNNIKFVWSDEYPSQPGWYWQRHILHKDEVYMVHVNNDKVDYFKKYVLIPNVEQWAGPIPLPVEKEE